MMREKLIEVWNAENSPCKTCLHKKQFCTGADGYPPMATIEYCDKGQWGNYPETLCDLSYVRSTCVYFVEYRP